MKNQPVKRLNRTLQYEGSILKIYSFTIITYKSVADIAVVKLDGYSNENVSDME